MHTELLGRIAEFLEKQELLSRLTEHENLHEYGISEIHVIAAIGRLEEPNVSAIARRMHMTCGAISKITKKLLARGVVQSYSAPDNRQKVFFRLTAVGERLFLEHERRHSQWQQRDEGFLAQFPETLLEQVDGFLDNFNAYLEEQIKELGGADNVN